MLKGASTVLRGPGAGNRVRLPDVRRHSEMNPAHERTAVARAEFFLALAEQCSPEQRTEFEAFLEAAIVFARAALHRLKNEFESHPSWNVWFAQLKGNPAVEFFREHRDFVLKEASPKVGQIISFNRVGTFKKQLAEVRYLTAEKRCNSIGEERNRQ